MKIFLIISLILNLIIVGCEIWILNKIRNKVNIIKYYTFLQNFISLIISIIFCVYLVIAIFFEGTIPQFIKGFRYIATSGLIATMFIYVVFLSQNSKNLMNEKDFISKFNPKVANFVFHYFCPIISLLSFVVFERQIVLNQPEWTLYVMIPSCLYWIIYLILSVTGLWKEPYDFSLSKNKNKFIEIITMISLPLSFILISYILWNIK